MPTAKHPITVLSHGFQRQLPAGRNATRAPIRHDVGFLIETAGQGGHAAGRTDGEVENVHGEHDSTEQHYCERQNEQKSCNDLEAMTTLGERLKTARLAKGEKWTHRHLGAVAGVSPATISMMERGIRGASERGSVPGSIPPIADALGVNYQWLAHGNGPMTGLADTTGALTKVAQADPLHIVRMMVDQMPGANRQAAVEAAIVAMLPFMRTAPATPAQSDDAPPTSKSDARPASPVAARK